MASNSEATGDAIGLLDERVQRWIWHQGWTAMRDIQQAAIPVILDESRDVVIGAATASGKTEAAFLPIASALLTGDAGLGVVAISPLRALINDQFERLELFCSEIGLTIQRWHGDVAASRKRDVLRTPPHILLITPESLEALFVLRGPTTPELFANIRYLVVDELHAFIGAERGKQLQSLLHRLEDAAQKRVPRIGLSATLGDMALAAEFLRPGDGGAAAIIKGVRGGQEIRLSVRGYETSPPNLTADAGSDQDETDTSDTVAIATHLFSTLRAGHNLIFANSRARVELLADLLRRMCEEASVANSFWPHHGSLAKEYREDVERRLKDKSAPANAVCTVTLELGIDIGAVESVAQVGAPASVASLRQRLGRSGRRGDPAILRVYVTEPALTSSTQVNGLLRDQIVQTVAVIELLLSHWVEPPLPDALHLSTLVQQTMSVIAQFGGVRPREAWQLLCGSGPFADVDAGTYGEFLRALASAELITQSSDGTLLLDAKGERIVGYFEFYAAFTAAEEFRLMFAGRPLGSLPVDHPVGEGSLLIFAGRRWRVISIELSSKTIHVEPAAGGRPPLFGGGRPPVHQRIREAMFAFYESEDLPRYLDPTAATMLEQGRGAFRDLGLDRTAIVEEGDVTLVFPWAGDRVMDTLVVALRTADLEAASEGLALVIEADEASVRSALADFAAGQLGDADALAATVLNKQAAKYDWALGEKLLTLDFARRALDVPAAVAVASRVSRS